MCNLINHERPKKWYGHGRTGRTADDGPGVIVGKLGQNPLHVLQGWETGFCPGLQRANLSEGGLCPEGKLSGQECGHYVLLHKCTRK